MQKEKHVNWGEDHKFISSLEAMQLIFIPAKVHMLQENQIYCAKVSLS